MIRAVVAASCAAVLFVGGVVAHAHEIGTTRVSVTLDRSETYRIEVMTDAAALADKLGAASGSIAGSTPTDPAMLRARVAALEELFRQRVVVQFDGSPVRPSIEFAITPPADSLTAPLATIQLAGRVPHGSRQLTWSYGWTFASYALTVRHAAGDEPATEWLEGGQRSKPVMLLDTRGRSSRAATAVRYLALGFTHIVPKGLDHMLFVLGIFLLTRRLRSVLWQVSAFTVAHSITLGLSIYGIISVAPSVVEPLIALSIAYVAIENLVMTELRPWRVGLVFAFGLLHGMGFAGALKDLGLPHSEFVIALVTFNLGVEAGQLAVIAAAFLAIGWWFGQRVWYRRLVVMPASALIACIAVYWTVQRLSL
jgi:HupE / UreJ protein